MNPLAQYVQANLNLQGMPRDVALSKVVQGNIEMQVNNVCNSPALIEAWSSNDLKKRDVWVHGWVDDLRTGRLSDMKISRGPNSPDV